MSIMARYNPAPVQVPSAIEAIGLPPHWPGSPVAWRQDPSGNLSPVGELDAACDRTLALRTARLRGFSRDEAHDWWQQGAGVTDFTARRTLYTFRPIAPWTPFLPGTMTPETEWQYLFVGGLRLVKGPDDQDWTSPLGRPEGRRCPSDPLWILDVLRGAVSVTEEEPGRDDARRCYRASLDLDAAGRALRGRIEIPRAADHASAVAAASPLGGEPPRARLAARRRVDPARRASQPSARQEASEAMERGRALRAGHGPPSAAATLTWAATGPPRPRAPYHPT
jgi:hypothetical protein